MSEPESYEAIRGKFVSLCIGLTPRILAPKRVAVAGAQFDAFAAHPKVVRVLCTAEAFGFVTARLVMSGEYGPRWAGAFAVKISAQKKEAYVQCRSLERPHNIVQHPHIASVDFGPCWGQNHDAVTKLRGDGDLAGLGVLIIGFLESYSPSAAYGGKDTIHYFPLLTKEEAAKWESMR